MNLHPYQQKAVDWITERDAVWLTADCGVGKTAIACQAVRELLFRTNVRGVLIVAPLRVVHMVWPYELEKWTPELSYTILHGTDKKNRLNGPQKDIYLTNYDSLLWLRENIPAKRSAWPFDAVIYDESSMLKNVGARRFRVWRNLYRLFTFRMHLTASPRPNSIEDLWTQSYILDEGERLGKTITEFRDRWMYKPHQNSFKHIPRTHAEDDIHHRISDLCYRISNDNVTLPPCNVTDIPVSLPPEAMKAYKELEKQFVLELNTLVTITAPTVAVLYNKCQQAASGIMYDADKKSHVIHTAKLDALKSLLSDLREPVIIAYTYQSDADAIKVMLPNAVNLTDASTEKKMNELVHQWNAGEIPYLIMHPASGGHGLNLQRGGRIVVWYGLNWSYDLWMQLNARVWRQGQTKPCLIYRIIAEDTIDEVIVSAVETKAEGQSGFFELLRRIKNVPV